MGLHVGRDIGRQLRARRVLSQQKKNQDNTTSEHTSVLSSYTMQCDEIESLNFAIALGMAKIFEDDTVWHQEYTCFVLFHSRSTNQFVFSSNFLQSKSRIISPCSTFSLPIFRFCSELLKSIPRMDSNSVRNLIVSLVTFAVQSAFG